MAAQDVANQTQSPEDRAAALAAFRAAYGKQDEMPDSERYVSYDIQNS